MCGLVFGLLVGVVAGEVGPVAGLGGPVAGLVAGLECGLVFGLIFGVGHDWAPAESLRFSAQRLRGGLVRGLVRGLFAGLCVGLLTGLGLGGGLVAGLAAGLGFGLTGLLFLGLLEALQTIVVNERAAPAEAVRRSRRYGLQIGTCAALLGVLLALATPSVEGALEGLGHSRKGILAGTPVGVALLGTYLGMSKGGAFAVRHYVVRFLLWRRNLAPRHYVPFLLQAAKLGVLKPVGGGFQFRHRELRRFVAERHGADWLNRAH